MPGWRKNEGECLIKLISLHPLGKWNSSEEHLPAKIKATIIEKLETWLQVSAISLFELKMMPLPGTMLRTVTNARNLKRTKDRHLREELILQR